MYPSLTDVEVARLVGDTLANSDLEIQNVDYSRALIYLAITIGDVEMRKMGLRGYIPKRQGVWNGCGTLRAKTNKEMEGWKVTSLQLPNNLKKVVLGKILEIAVLLMFNSHVYTFAGEIFLQKSGAPIGLRSSAAIARLIMKLHDRMFLNIPDVFTVITTLEVGLLRIRF